MFVLFTSYLFAQYGDHGPCPKYGCRADRRFHIRYVSRLEASVSLISQVVPKQGFMGPSACRLLITFKLLETQTDGA